MGISIMRLATLWLVASAETLRVHGASAAAQGARGVQGRDPAKGKGLSKKQQRAEAAAAKEVCSVNDSPATCRELTAKYRGGAATTGGGGEAMSLNVIKMLLQMCLTTLNVACWLVPMKIRSFVESKRAISMANAFSGGVFLSLAFGHMIPHATHGFEDSGLPENLPYFLTLSGYMLIFFVEKIAFDAHHIMHEAVDGDDHGSSGGGGAVAVAAGGKGDGGDVAAGGLPSGRSAIILLLALGVHAMMETMALGLSSNKLSAGLLAMSIGLHQPAESLALLVSFLKSGLTERQVVKYLSIFSCIGPVGLSIGIAISEFAGKLADAVLVAMAAGTFIYVGATEVIAEEFESPHDKWKKFFALSAGIVIIAFITNWAESLEHMA